MSSSSRPHGERPAGPARLQVTPGGPARPQVTPGGPARPQVTPGGPVRLGVAPANQVTDDLLARVGDHLDVLYPRLDAAARGELARRATTAIGLTEPLVPRDPVDTGAPADDCASSRPVRARRPGRSANQLWTEADAMLVTYADTLLAADEAPLTTLRRFVVDDLAGAFSAVHLLPFFPFSSDDGFSVVDFEAVRPEVGTWDDVEALADEVELMFDLVLNHASVGSAWFAELVADVEPGRRWFVTAEPDDDLDSVVRPRSAPLLRPTDTAAGRRHVWCTFSHDQADLDWSQPDLLCEMLRIVGRYLRSGARYLRLDAVAYVWKRPGTPCMHLQQTHELVKLLRTLVEARAPGSVLITETNVPNTQNLRYFGHGDEAHVIYNFSLPPLVLHALLAGRSEHLRTWMMSMPAARDGTAYLNFLSSHDGIGLRPAEGLLDDADIDAVIDTVSAGGGLVSYYDSPSGPRPYELNTSLFDALGQTFHGDEAWHLERFVCAHAIMLAIEGIPALYIHSLLATKGDPQLVAATGRNRSINRRQLRLDDVREALADPGDPRAQAFAAITTLLELRGTHPAFHPNATQFTLHLGQSLFGCWRQSRDRLRSVFAVSNVTAEPVDLRIDQLNLVITEEWVDLLSGQPVRHDDDRLALVPYQTVWITNTAS